MRPTFALLTTAGPEIGMGHAVRMVALATALIRRGRDVVLYSDNLPYITERLRVPCIACDVGTVDAGTPVPPVVVVDAPHRMDLMSGHGAVIVFDDYGPPLKQHADTVVNPHVNAAGYFGCRALRGPGWLPLREGFSGRSNLPAHRWGHVVLCYHADRAAEVDSLGYHVETPSWDLSDTMPDFLAAADLAVIPASMIAYECMAVGTPCLVYAPTPQHEGIAAAMVKRGCALHYSMEALTEVAQDRVLRERLQRVGMTMVDGQGAERLATVLEGIF
jgi:spore coat polysaccharide biosynthesis predicted glycosyltransferase SpsG